MVQWFNSFKNAKLISITSNDIELEEQTEEEKKEKEEKAKDLKSLFDLVKSTIWEDKIEDVVLNDKLWTALWALKTWKNWIDPQLEKMMKAMWQEVPTQKRILELNPKNPIIDSMKDEFNRDIKSEKLSNIMKYAYNQAILLEWGELENPAEFIELTNKFASWYLK